MSKVITKPKPSTCLSFWFQSDFSGCGKLRTIIPNDVLNSIHAQNRKKLYEGIVSSRLYISEQLLSRVSVIHFQRQTSDSQLEYMRLLREARDKHPALNYKIIYDLDDLIGEVPLYNFASKLYNEPNTVKNLKEVADIVDTFTVSTYPLKKKIAEMGGSAKIKIVPNYLAKYLYRPYEFEKKENVKPKIVWAGSPTHFNLQDKGDFQIIYDLMANTADEFNWVILGLRECPVWLKPIEDKIEIISWVGSIYQYPTALKELNADFGVAPLLNNSFNQCKSNIKLLDYASADMMAVCSKLTPYKESQLFFSGDWKTDRDMIIDVFQNKQKREEIICKQRKMLDGYWMETKGVKKYRDMLGF